MATKEQELVALKIASTEELAAKTTALGEVLAAQTAAEHDPTAAEDFWCADDLAILAHNLLAAAAQTRTTPADWLTWPVDRTGFDRRWIHV